MVDLSSKGVSLNVPIITAKVDSNPQAAGWATGLTALLTGLVGVQKLLATWLDGYKRYGAWWRARSALKEFFLRLPAAATPEAEPLDSIAGKISSLVVDLAVAKGKPEGMGRGVLLPDVSHPAGPLFAVFVGLNHEAHTNCAGGCAIALLHLAANDVVW